MSQQASDPLIGRVLSGRFEIIAPIGIGGMGRVYKAIQRPLDRIVAVKVLNPQYDGTRDPGFEKRFFLEASMTAKLKHPNTITVHDYGRTDDGIYFLAMELLEGDTLQQALAANGAMAWPRALFIGAQIARSLREAHKFGLVHRDLKPANIMILSEGTGGDVVKVLDFGLVKSFMGEAHPIEADLDRTGITQAGVLLGSPMYMSPEQARNETDQRSDIYSLGVVLFQVIAGRPPFVGKESIDVIVKHIRERPPELRALVPDLPLEVHSIVMKCLEKAPEARFQNMDELLEAMQVATTGQGISGIFADPRTLSSSQVPRAKTGGVDAQSATPAGIRLSPPRPRDEVARGDSIPVDLSFSYPGTAPPRRAMIGGLVGLIVAGVSIGGFIAFKTRPARPVVVATAPAVVPVAPLPEVARAARVVFEVSSEPPGARVTRDGAPVGVTPLSLTVERSGLEEAKLELLLSLEGYTDAKVLAQGSAGRVAVRQVLLKKEPLAPQAVHPVTPPARRKPAPARPDNPPGYKDDPYQ